MASKKEKKSENEPQSPVIAIRQNFTINYNADGNKSSEVNKEHYYLRGSDRRKLLKSSDVEAARRISPRSQHGRELKSTDRAAPYISRSEEVSTEEESRESDTTNPQEIKDLITEIEDLFATDVSFHKEHSESSKSTREREVEFAEQSVNSEPPKSILERQEEYSEDIEIIKPPKSILLRQDEHCKHSETRKLSREIQEEYAQRTETSEPSKSIRERQENVQLRNVRDEMSTRSKRVSSKPFVGGANIDDISNESQPASVDRRSTKFQAKPEPPAISKPKVPSSNDKLEELSAKFDEGASSGQAFSIVHWVEQEPVGVVESSPSTSVKSVLHSDPDIDSDLEEMARDEEEPKIVDAVVLVKGGKSDLQLRTIDPSLSKSRVSSPAGYGSPVPSIKPRSVSRQPKTLQVIEEAEAESVVEVEPPPHNVVVPLVAFSRSLSSEGCQTELPPIPESLDEEETELDLESQNSSLASEQSSGLHPEVELRNTFVDEGSDQSFADAEKKTLTEFNDLQRSEFQVRPLSRSRHEVSVGEKSEEYRSLGPPLSSDVTPQREPPTRFSMTNVDTDLIDEEDELHPDSVGSEPPVKTFRSGPKSPMQSSRAQTEPVSEFESRFYYRPPPNLSELQSLEEIPEDHPTLRLKKKHNDRRETFKTRDGAVHDTLEYSELIDVVRPGLVEVPLLQVHREQLFQVSTFPDGAEERISIKRSKFDFVGEGGMERLNQIAEAINKRD